MLSLRVAQRASALGHVRFAPTLSTGLLKVPGRSYASPSSSSTQGSLASLVSNKALVQTTSFIGNKFVSASSSSGKTFAVHDPANNALLANVVEGASEDGPVLDAIARSQKAFESWRKTTPKVRQELLLKLYKLMQENAEDLAQIIVSEAMPQQGTGILAGVRRAELIDRFLFVSILLLASRLRRTVNRSQTHVVKSHTRHPSWTGEYQTAPGCNWALVKLDSRPISALQH